MRRKLFLLVLVVMVMLTGCGGNKISFNTVMADIEELSAEPENWQSAEAICLYEETKLPVGLQREYIRIAQKNYSKIKLATPKGGTIDLLSDEEGIYLKNRVKFFRSGNSIVLISKSWRTMNRQEYTEEAKFISSQIEIDIPDEATEYVKVAETQTFSIVYDTESNQYVCINYGVVLGTNTATNLNSLLHAKMIENKGEETGNQLGFKYKSKEYIMLIDINAESTTFSVIEKEEFSKSYQVEDFVVEDIFVNSNLILKACVIIH